MALCRIWLCADDYGISPSVNAAIRLLILRGRINATSVMVAAPHFDPDAAATLAALNAGTPRAALGLHVTLSAPFAPLSEGFSPLAEGRFPPLRDMFQLALMRRLTPARLAAEIGAQLRLFRDTFARPPDFLDGHQHVHLFPQVRDAFLKAVAEDAPQAWVRQCGRRGALRSWLDPKALLLDALSLGFRRNAARRGIATNVAFAGTYDFKADFARLFPRFLAGCPDGGLIMCHPGFVDAALKSLDPLTDAREREFAYFDSDAFTYLLAAQGAVLARPEATT